MCPSDLAVPCVFCVILKSVLLGYLLVPGCIIIFFNGSGLNWFLVVCLAGLIGVIFCVWLQPVEEPSYVYQCPVMGRGLNYVYQCPVMEGLSCVYLCPVIGEANYVYQCPVMGGLVMYTSVQLWKA